MSYLLTLRPNIGIVDPYTSEVEETSIREAETRRVILGVSDLSGPEAIRIVRESLSGIVKIRQLGFDIVTRQYNIEFSASSSRPYGGEHDLLQSLQSHYGQTAADTWMEGNIEIRRYVELHLKFVRLARVQTVRPAEKKTKRPRK